MRADSACPKVLALRTQDHLISLFHQSRKSICVTAFCKAEIGETMEAGWERRAFWTARSAPHRALLSWPRILWTVRSFARDVWRGRGPCASFGKGASCRSHSCSGRCQSGRCSRNAAVIGGYRHRSACGCGTGSEKYCDRPGGTQQLSQQPTARIRNLSSLLRARLRSCIAHTLLNPSHALFFTARRHLPIGRIG